MRHEDFLRPLALPPQQQDILAKPFFRVRRRQGRRHLVFVPGAVFKLGLRAAERRMLSAEVRATAAAARNPFWNDLPIRTYSLPGAGVANRRFRPARLADFDSVAALVEDRLEASCSYPRRPMRRDVAARPVLRLLDARERAQVDALLGDEDVPESSMHGDLHLYNFVVADDGFRLIDWEHYDAGGSFAFDYVDFHVAVDHDNGQRSWSETLAGVGPRHRAVQRASRLYGVSPRALATYYRLIKIDTIMARRGGPERLTEPERAGYLSGVRRLLASLTAAIGSTTETAAHYALLLCAA